MADVGRGFCHGLQGAFRTVRSGQANAMGVPSITRVSSFTSFNCDGLCPPRTRPRRCCRPLGAINAMESARDRVRIAGSGKRAGARASGRTPGVASSGERRARRLFREKPEEMRRGAGHGGFTGDTDGLGTRTGKRGRGAMMTGHRIIARSRRTIRVVGSMAMSRALTISLGAVIVIAQSHRHRRRSLDRKSEYCDQEQEASDQDAHGRGVYGPVFRVCKAAGLLSIPEPFRCNLPTPLLGQGRRHTPGTRQPSVYWIFSRSGSAVGLW